MHGAAARPQTGTVPYSFAGAPDGYAPAGSLVDVNGTLFGTTAFGGTGTYGGTDGGGTVFSLVP